MHKKYVSRFLYLFLSTTLLLAPLPVCAIAQAIADSMYDKQTDIFIYENNSIYVCLDKDRSKLAKVVEEIYRLDDDASSSLSQLYENIVDGHSIVEREKVMQALTHAESLIQKSSHDLDPGYVEQIVADLNEIIDLVSYDESVMRARHINSLVVNKLHINKWLHVRSKSKFNKHIRTKQGVTISGHLKVGKSATFRDDVIVEGDFFAQNAQIDNLTVTGSLSFTNLSVVDATISGVLTVNDIVVENCINDLCVNDLSVVDQSVSGTLSANDAIIQNLTVNGNLAFANLSVVDATVSGVLTVNDIVIENCINDLCVNNLSAVDESVSGTLSVNEEVIKTFLRLQDFVGGEYVGLQAPSVVPTSYTVSLPSTVPLPTQVLQAGAITPTNLEWVTPGGGVAPAASKTIYVAKYGNDTTGNGSFDFPYLTLSKAIAVANGLASLANPIAIVVAAGIYTENNSSGPLSVTASGISITGSSANTTIIMPNTPANNFLVVNNAIRITNITLQSASPLATGISLNASALSVLNNVRIINFLIGVSCTGTPADIYGFISCFFLNNVTALFNNNAFVECNGCTIFGVDSIGGPAANTGISMTGANARLLFTGGICGLCATGFDVMSNSFCTINATAFRRNTFDIVQTGASQLVVSASNFEITNTSTETDISVSDIGTVATILGCEFNGDDSLGMPQATALLVKNDATVNFSSNNIYNYDTAIHIGISTDASSTALMISDTTIKNCITDVLQEGSSSLNFNSGVASGSKIVINDPTNVILAFFDIEDNGALTIGSTANQDTVLIQAAIDPTNHPSIDYKSSLYSTEAIGFENTFGSSSSWFAVSNAETYLTGITTDRTKVTGLQLLSDEGSPIGGTSALRGWDINKNSSTAELSLSYHNTDIVGQPIIAPYTVMQLDGVNNQVQLPTPGTQIVFAGDTNLYRDSADVLKTDDDFIVGTLTPDRVVITDAITNQLSSSIVTATELGYLSGVTSPIQAQLNAKVNKSGDVMTGTLELPAGSTASPSLIFTGSTSTGLSANSNILSFSNLGIESMNINASGIVTIDGFTTAGVVHNNALGNLSSSLIVNSDITNATISNAKLATISSLDVPGDIVVRDGSGNFATNMITIDGAVVNPTDVATKAYVDAAIALGLAVHQPALVVSTTNQALSGLPTIDGVSLSVNDRVLLTGQTNPVENGLWLAQIGSWTRPVDFASGTPAGQAYVLILSGTLYTGSSWLCSTPTAIIDTNSIFFSLFSLPDVTTGANVGVGTGLVFKNKTGITLNFRSLLAAPHIAITTNTDDITFATDATDINTSSTIVARDASGNFSAGTITANLTGAASLNVLKTGDTMTGALQLPAGTTALPSLNFTGSPTTGLSANSNTLSFSNSGVETMNIDSSGVVTINGFTTAGIVHNNASGNLSSSLIVNADVDPAAGIVDTKLATISTAGKVANSATTATSLNVANTIVLRDASGNFNAGTIIANLMGAASDNVLKTGDTMTGTLQLPAGTTALPALVFTGSTTSGLSASAGNLSISTNGLERLKIASGGAISIDAFTSAGVVHNDSSGDLSSSLIVNADVDPAAGIVDTKLATISTAGKVANSATTATSANTPNTIVLRNGSGNFAAGTITASLTGAASLNVLKTGDTMTGTLTHPAGTAAAPSIQFTGSINTGLSAPSANVLSFSTNGAQRMSISNTAITVLQDLIVNEQIAFPSIEQFTVTANGQTFNVAATTSVLILSAAANFTNFTIVFPGSPINGQLFTIMTTSTNSIGIINNGNGAAVANGITSLDANAAPAGTTGGAAVTYLYLLSANTWHRYSRG